METGTEGNQQDAGLADTPLHVDMMDDLVLLDSSGDAVLSVEHPETHRPVRFLVSTKVLSLASPVFAKMFGPDFQEGHRLRRGETIQVELEDDDSLAMEVILKALHFYRLNQCLVGVERLVSIAKHCDKYDCTSALSSWICCWFENLAPISRRPEELGFLLLAAYTFNDAIQFKSISARALRDMSLQFPLAWQGHNILNSLPDDLQAIMTSKIQGMLRQLHFNIYSVETTLRQTKSGYDMHRNACMNCGSDSHPCCNNPKLYQKYCTYESRVADYFAVLENVNLWPSVTSNEVCSLSDHLLRLTCAKDALDHSCAAGSKCPLNSGLGQLCEKVRLFETSVVGLSLRCFKYGKNDASHICICTDQHMISPVYEMDRELN